MFSITIISVVLASAAVQSQFVFFGGQQQQPQQQRFNSRPSLREGRLLVEPQFANTLFRPTKKIEKPSKEDALPCDEKKKEELVQILTEVPRTAIAPGSSSEKLVSQSAQPVPAPAAPQSVPAPAAPQPIPAPVAPQSLPAPAAPQVVVTSNLSSRPPTRILGQSTVRQLGQSVA